MASIFILFPKENTEYISTALQHYKWAVERFETMAERNRLAAAARGVLNAIYVRLKKSLGMGIINAREPVPGPGPGPGPSTKGKKTWPESQAPSGDTRLACPFVTTVGSPNGAYTRGESLPSAVPGGGPFGSLSTASTAAASGTTTPPIDPGLGGETAAAGDGDWTLPEGFDWGSIQPVYAMADIAYNDLMGINSSSNGGGGISSISSAGGETTAVSVPSWAGGAPLLNEVSVSGSGDSQPWLFGGDFGNDSVWNLLNQYPSPY